MTKAEIQQNYEYNTGKVIIEMLSKNKVNPINVPAILVSNHGPFI
jgi:hypothetical protein